MEAFSYQTQIGDLTIVSNGDYLVEIIFGKALNSFKNVETEVIKEAYRQLCEYFEGRRKVFDIKFKIELTPFRDMVLNEVLKIPYGQTKYYSDITKALMIKNPNLKGCNQAVGSAVNKNPLPIIIPCHRVIGKANKYLYSAGEKIKQMLMAIEKIE